MHTIEIDCPPFSLRPFELLPRVLEGTGLQTKDFDLTSSHFGCFEWSLSEGLQLNISILGDGRVLIAFVDLEEIYTKNVWKIKNKLVGLQADGLIRYASW